MDNKTIGILAAAATIPSLLIIKYSKGRAKDTHATIDDNNNSSNITFSPVPLPTPIVDSNPAAKQLNSIQKVLFSNSDTESAVGSVASQQSSMDSIVSASNFNRRNSSPSPNSHILPASIVDSTQIISGNNAVAHIGYAFSELNLVYPLTATDYIGEDLISLSDADRKGAFGQIGKVKLMETRSGAGDTLYGAVSGGAVCTVYTSSQTLRLMRPSLLRMRKERLPTVIHISAGGIGSNLERNMDCADIMAFSETGIVLLASNTPQEAHDMAIVAHVIAMKLSIPVIHYFNSIEVGDVVSSLDVIPMNELKSLVDEDILKSHHNRLFHSNIVSENNEINSIHSSRTLNDEIESEFIRIMDELSHAVFGGHIYSPIEYYGPNDAEVVMVVSGSAFPIAANVVDMMNNRANGESHLEHSTVGVVNIRVVRPFNASTLINMIPNSVKRVSVLDQSTGEAPLASSILSALSGTGKLITMGRYNTPSNALLAATLENIESENPCTGFVLGKDITESSSYRFISNATSSYIQWSNISSSISEKETMGAMLRVLRGLHHANVTGKWSYDSYRAGGVVCSEIKVGVSNEAFPVIQADVVAVHNADMLSKYNVLDRLSSGGSLVVNATWGGGSMDVIEENLSADFRAELYRKRASFVLVDAAAIIASHGLPESAVSILLQAIVLAVGHGRSDWAEVSQLLVSNIYSQISAVSSDSSIITKWSDAIGTIPNLIHRIQAPNYWSRSNESILNYLPSYTVGNLNVASSSDDSINLNSSMVANRNARHKTCWGLLFPEAYNTKRAEHVTGTNDQVHLVPLTKYERLTPDTYDRNVFHLEFDISKSKLKYQLGDALGICAHNDYAEVEAFLQMYNLDGEELVHVPFESQAEIREGLQEIMSIRQIFTRYLDLFGRPSKRFYKALVEFAVDIEEKVMLATLADSELGIEEFQKRVDETYTFADVLREFPSARPNLQQLMGLLQPIKMRHYSIASSSRMHPTSVHLLVVAVEWKTPSGKSRLGQCTRYLVGLEKQHRPMVSVSVMTSVMRLPEDPLRPVIMAGLGTGMAPFRAFIQERVMMKREGIKVGPMSLYFGSRSRKQEWLYGDELEGYHAEGLLTNLRLAFSRDQAYKIYIQHKVAEDEDQIWDYLINENGSFYLCGPTWPAQDVRETLIQGFSNVGDLSDEEAVGLLDSLPEEKPSRYVLEVY